MSKFLAMALGSFALTGCATKPVNYYYGDYSRALYRSKKDNTPASVEKYRLSLEDIIHTSEKKGLRVPPGVYCEYAYMLAIQGNSEAENYFALEIKTYPESERFVTFIRTQLSKPPST